jgi:carbonic anhydrase
MIPSANSHCATDSNQSPINIEVGNTIMTTVGVWLNISSLASVEIEDLGNTVEVALAGFRRWKGVEGKGRYINF